MTGRKITQEFREKDVEITAGEELIPDDDLDAVVGGAYAATTRTATIGGVTAAEDDFLSPDVDADFLTAFSGDGRGPSRIQTDVKLKR